MNITYPLHILRMQMWHYEEVADKWNKEIEKHGPEEHSVRFHTEAISKMEGFKDAITKLEQMYKSTTQQQ